MLALAKEPTCVNPGTESHDVGGAHGCPRWCTGSARRYRPRSGSTRPDPWRDSDSRGGGGFLTYIDSRERCGVFVAVNRLDFQMFYGMTATVNDLIANLMTR